MWSALEQNTHAVRFESVLPGCDGIFLRTHGSGQEDHQPLMENEQRVELSFHVSSLSTSIAVLSVSIKLSGEKQENHLRCRCQHAGLDT